jgi:ABC-type spermidine/putrescine transport system permease subunit I
VVPAAVTDAAGDHPGLQFRRAQRRGRVCRGFTLANYLNLGSRAAAFGNTLVLAPLGTLVCLVAAYPLAYFLAVKVMRKTVRCC